MSDPRLEVFLTPRDWFRHAVSRFNEAGLVFGHGATNAIDEAAFMILEGLHLPIDALDPFADARLLVEERQRLAELDRRARDDPQASRLSAQPRLYPGRSVLCRRTRHRAAQLHRRTAVHRNRRRERADRFARGDRDRARPLHRRRFARHPRRRRLPDRARSTPSTSAGTRSRWRAATSRCMGSRTASSWSRATCSSRSAGAATI